MDHDIICLETFLFLSFFFFFAVPFQVSAHFSVQLSLSFFKLIFRSSQPFVSSGDYRFYLQHCGSTLYSPDEVFDQ